MTHPWIFHKVIAICLLLIHYLFRTLPCSWLYMSCSWLVYDFHMACSWLSSLPLFITCLWVVYNLMMASSWLAQVLVFSTWSYFVHHLFVNCSSFVHVILTYSLLRGLDLLITCSKLVHDFIHDLLMTCSWIVNDLHMTCSAHALAVSTCSWLKQNFIITSSWDVHGAFMTYYLLMNCSFFIYDMSCLVHNFFIMFSWLVHNSW